MEASAERSAPDHRWLILAVLGLAQLMVVLDATVVNIALPSAQEDLGFSESARQWIVTAYSLAFGSLLLLGGRISDLFGRRLTFLIGLVGFAAASAIGGAAPSFGVLVGARAIQGIFGAILAPAALSLLTVTFTDPAERGKAFGIFGALAGSGAAVGLLLGGVLTEYLSWRWCLFVNIAFAVVAVFGVLALLQHDRPADHEPLDIPGTALATAGLFCLVYGFSNAQQETWTAPLTLVMFAAAIVLLVTFVGFERRASHPLMPIHIVADRDRGGSYLAVAFAAVAIFAVFLFLTYFLQQNLDYTPLVSGLAFLPMVACIMTTSISANVALVPRVGPRPLVTLGMLLGAAGMFFLTGIGTDATYASEILPGLIVCGLGFGLIFAPAIATATLGIEPKDAGIASALVNTSQQVGGSIGVALLSTIAAGADAEIVGKPSAAKIAAAAVPGYTTAFYVSGGIFVLGAIVAWTLIRPKHEQPVAASEAAPGGPPPEPAAS